MVRNTFIYIIIFFLTFTNISSQEIKGLSGFSKQDDLDPTMKLELQKIGRDVINFLRWKRLPQAEKKLKEYESLQSTTDEFFYLRSSVNFTKKQLNLSESDLKTTLAINAKHEAAYYLIGMVYGIWSDWNRSKEAFKVAVELSAEEAQPLKHNPEGVVEKKQTNLFAQKAPKTTRDLVFSKLFNQ